MKMYNLRFGKIELQRRSSKYFKRDRRNLPLKRSGYGQEIDSDEDNAQPPFKLTISEYEEVAARHEASLKLLDLVKSAIDTPENTRAMSERIERECE